MTTTIGFVGLGIMGKPMAKNLINAGYTLRVFDLNQAPVDEIVNSGATKCGSASEVASASDVVIVMVPDSADSEAAVLTEKGVLAGSKPNTIIIDMSSINPLVSQKIAKACGEKQVEFLDAPVSGGEPGAIEGTLAIMVGGKQDIFNKCIDILTVLGKSVVRVGEVGAGNTTKLANQICVAVNIAGLSEALVLASKAGLDPSLVFDAIKGGLAGSNVMNAKAPMMMDRNFKPGFRIKLHQKDLNNALTAGKDLGVSLPFTGLIQQVLGALVTDGKGDQDHSGVVQFIESMAKVEVKKG